MIEQMIVLVDILLILFKNEFNYLVANGLLCNVR